MRRLGRWIGNGLAVLSLLACVAACALWARGYWASIYWVLSLNRPADGGVAGVVNDSHSFYAGAGGFFYQHERGLILDPARFPAYESPREFVSLSTAGPNYPHSSPLTPSPLNRMGVEWSQNQWSTAFWRVSHFSVTL